MDRTIRTNVPPFLFPDPAYAVLGDHDYEAFRVNKVETELAYTRQGSREEVVVRYIGKDARVLYELKKSGRHHGILVIAQPNGLLF